MMKSFASRLPLLPAVLSLLLMAGCAYELSVRQVIARPVKIQALARLTVAPFQYPSDWTGLFRDVYKKAGIEAPKGRRIELIEGAFLIRDVLIAKGYQVVRWPRELEKKKTDDLLNKEGKIAEAHLSALRDTGAQAVAIAAGERSCEDVEVCAARVEIHFLDLNSEDTLWESQVRATTALAHGDEMKAAVSKALDAFPEKSAASE